MYIIEVDHIILFLTTDTHSYSKKESCTEAQNVSARQPHYSIWSYRRLNTLETKTSFTQQNGHSGPSTID
ncbi:hypothetical protein HMPREF1144_4306 [Klebsiella sp. OBRC7]|nr:hypothetical protein HMPREF1144_4306 [Klebsiella sp. OBRC7]